MAQGAKGGGGGGAKGGGSGADMDSELVVDEEDLVPWDMIILDGEGCMRRGLLKAPKHISGSAWGLGLIVDIGLSRTPRRSIVRMPLRGGTALITADLPDPFCPCDWIAENRGPQGQEPQHEASRGPEGDPSPTQGGALRGIPARLKVGP